MIYISALHSSYLLSTDDNNLLFVTLSIVILLSCCCHVHVCDNVFLASVSVHMICIFIL